MYVSSNSTILLRLKILYVKGCQVSLTYMSSGSTILSRLKSYSLTYMSSGSTCVLRGCRATRHIFREVVKPLDWGVKPLDNSSIPIVKLKIICYSARHLMSSHLTGVLSRSTIARPPLSSRSTGVSIYLTMARYPLLSGSTCMSRGCRATRHMCRVTR